MAGLYDSVRDGERLSRNALEYARRFSWNRTAEEFLRVLRLVVDDEE